MSFHAAIWMDHAEAHVLSLDNGQTSIRRVVSRCRHRPHEQTGPLADHAYFDELALALSDAQEVLVTGPSDAKQAFVDHLHAHCAEIGRKIVGIETLDHPSDAQLAAHARKFFLRTDRLNGNPA